MSACPRCGGVQTVDTSDGKFTACLECGFSLQRIPSCRGA